MEIWSGRADSETARAVARMFALADDPKPPELVDWQYVTHLGGAYVAIAHDGSGPVEGGGAMYAAFPARVRCDGTTGTVIQSFDTLTLPDYRGQGLFGKLAEVVYRLADEDGVIGVYGFPNAASAPGFAKKLSWTMMDPLPVLARPIGSRYPRVRAGVRTPMVVHAPADDSSASAGSEVPDDVDELFDSVAGEQFVGVERSAEYLRWRLARPGSTYRVSSVRGEGGQLDALCVTELTVKHGCALGYVMELLHRPGRAQAGRAVLRAALADLKRSRADLVLAWSLPGSPARRVLGRAGFLPLPERVRPVELHFGARPFEAGSGSLVERTRWYLSYLDSDTV